MIGLCPRECNSTVGLGRGWEVGPKKTVHDALCDRPRANKPTALGTTNRDKVEPPTSSRDTTKKLTEAIVPDRGTGIEKQREVAGHPGGRRYLSQRSGRLGVPGRLNSKNLSRGKTFRDEKGLVVVGISWGNAHRQGLSLSCK